MNHKINSINLLFINRNMICSIFTFCEVFIFLLFSPQPFVTSDVSKNNTIYESDINFTTDNAMYNESDQDVLMLNQSMDDFDFNKSSWSNISFDVSTELESTISVTEDSDNSLQSDSNRDLFLFLTPDKDICNCDLSVSVCDINCCCDPDCSEEDIQIFSECSHQVLTADENYCYQTDIILRNNTVYKMVKDPNSALFCIVHDNFKHHLRFKDMPVLKSHRDVTTVLKYKYKTTYSWDAESEITYDSREPRAGNPIYIDVRSNKKIISTPWSLPSSCLSDVCSCRDQVRYLVNFRSSCSHVIHDLHSECEHSDVLSGDRFADFCISADAMSLTDLVIHTKMVHSNSSDDEFYSSLTTKICVKNKRRPERQSGRCENVVRHVYFTVEQDGVRGIVGVKADFRYDSLPLMKESTLFTQSYSVDFVWTNATSSEKKSGNPGYQIGLPVLAATNVSEEMSKVFYEDGLSVLSTDSGGYCANTRKTIKFGHNLRSGCILRHDFSDCRSLRGKVSDVLLGPNKRQIFVGVFGNANISNPGDWIEVFHGPDVLGDDSNCMVSVGLKIHIVYAAVGTFANPQYKIVGVRYSYSKQEFVELSCAPNCGGLGLSTSVSFFDVTLPAVEHYAKVPSIKVNLPSDFFYPFLYGRSTQSTKSEVYLVVILFLCLYFCTK